MPLKYLNSESDSKYSEELVVFLTITTQNPQHKYHTHIPYKHRCTYVLICLWKEDIYVTYARTTSTQVIKVRQHQEVALHADMLILQLLRGQKSNCRRCQVL